MTDSLGLTDEDYRIAQAEEWEKMQSHTELQMLQEMIYEKAIPKHIKDQLWGLASKFIVLGNSQDVDERIFLREFDITVNDFLKSLTLDDLNSDLLNAVNNMKVIYRAALTRSKGSDRERKLQSMQWQIMQHINTNERQGTGQKSMPRRILNGMNPFGRKKPTPAAESFQGPFYS